MIKKFIKENYKLIITIIAGLFLSLFIINTLYYYKNLRFNSILKMSILVYNKILMILYYLVKNLFDAIIQENILIIITTGVVVILVLDKLKKMDVFKNISSIEFKDFKVIKAIEAKTIEEHSTTNDTDNTNINNNQGKGGNVEEGNSGDTKNNKSRIESLIIDSPFLASIIDAYLKRGSKISINLNLIPYKVKLSSIEEIFEYKLKANSIEIIRLKPEIESLVIDTFKELMEKGIIYI